MVSQMRTLARVLGSNRWGNRFRRRVALSTCFVQEFVRYPFVDLRRSMLMARYYICKLDDEQGEPYLLEILAELSTASSNHGAVLN